MMKEQNEAYTLDDLVTEKSRILKLYKKLAEDIEFIDNDFEMSLVEEERQKYAVRIKNISKKIEEMQNLKT